MVKPCCFQYARLFEDFRVHNFYNIYYNFMNITSSVPNIGPACLESLHKMYVQGKEQPNENQRDIKFKSKIRIKSKSQGKFILNADKQHRSKSLYKTVNLISMAKQSKNTQLNKVVQEKKNNILLEENKLVNNKRQLLFLKELVNKRKQAPLNCSINVSKSQIQLNQSKMLKQRNFSTTFGTNIEFKLCNYNDSQANLIQWQKKVDQYHHYDNIVKNLLSQMSTRKTQSKNRPLISPKKYQQAKQKLLGKIQGDYLPQSGQCNFKSVIKLQPKKEGMVFRMTDFIADTVYERKITSYIKFLYKINFANCIYADLSLSNPGKIYKVKIGPGNNSQLIKTLLKRRFWLEIDNSLQVGETSQQNKISFIWTQNTIDNVFKIQKYLGIVEPTAKKLEQNQKLLKKIKKYKKNQKKKQSFYNNQKILNSLQSEQVQTYFSASNNGSTSIHNKIQPEIVSNHIPLNYIIGSKKILFLVLHWYYQNIIKIDPFTYLPKTYNIRSGQVTSPVFQKFIKNQGQKPDSVWIVKPGQNTNRGNGINVSSFSEVNKLIRKRELHKNGEQKTYIIQKYLKPFLYNGRKFDIRHYLLITVVQGNLRAYWYKEGYIRTSSEKYDLEDLSNEFVHLTNDAIQKKSQLYGKYQPGNKLSYTIFQRYLDQNYPQKKYSFENQILKKMKQITTDLIHASFSFLDPERKNHNFQLYGMDFMINSKFQPFLIEVNANPCLQVSCPVLERIIPTLVQHTFRLALDPLFPPPQHYPVNCRYQLSDRILQKLKFQLIFDQKTQGTQIRQKIQFCENKFTLCNKNKLQPDEQIFQDDGQSPQNFEID